MTEERFKATTATTEELAAITKFMELMAQLEGQTIDDLYKPGSTIRVGPVGPKLRFWPG